MDYLFCLFRQYCTFSKKYISEEDYNKFLIFLRENALNEIGDVFIHKPSYEYTIDSTEEFAKEFAITSTTKEIVSAMKAPIEPEIQQIMHAHLETIDDRFVPRDRDHIFQIFKQKIVDNFNIRMSLMDYLKLQCIIY